jgi:hypothetical protein
MNGSLAALSLAIASVILVPMAKGADEPLVLRPAKPMATQVEARLEVTGELKLFATPGGPVQQKSTIPLVVSAHLRYSDRPLPAGGKTLRHSVRLFDQAQVKMHVGKGDVKSQLSDDRRLIVVAETKDDLELFSPSGPLQRDELELLTVPGDSGLLDLLLPTREVKAGDTWEPPIEVLTRLLRLDVVNQNDVKVELLRVDQGIAIISIAGSASGGVEGVTSDIELSGKLNFDLSKKCCTWLALYLKEDRAASLGAPGFATTSQIRVAVAPRDAPAELSDEALAGLKTSPDESTRLLRFVSQPQGFEFIYEPDWRVISNQNDLAVLRLIERGELVAQCNISRLAPLGAGEQLTLEAYQAGLKKSLGTTFGDFVEAGESLSDSGLRVLRVVIAATVSEVPIHYVFCHLSDDHQNRLSLAFTMDADNVERFARSEETVIDSLQFTAKIADDETKPTEQAKAEKKSKR